MSNDILKDYFSTKATLVPNIEFEKNLIKKLEERIYKIERRKKVLSMLLIIFVALLVISAVILSADYFPLFDILAPIAEAFKSLSVIDSSLYMIVVFVMCVALGCIYVVNSMSLKKLKQELYNLR